MDWSRKENFKSFAAQAIFFLSISLMQKYLSVSLLFFVGLLPLSVSGADFYVSPKGNDAWTGKLTEPNAQKTDGPFGTLERARDAVRKVKAEAAGRDLVVQIRGGQYQLRESIVFGMEDSGDADTKVIYEAYPDEKPIFHSDIALNDWKKLKKPVRHLPKAARGKVWVMDVSKIKGAPNRFFTMYDAEGRLPRARSKGFIPIKSKGSSLVRLKTGQK